MVEELNDRHVCSIHRGTVQADSNDLLLASSPL
jgi:hypothetical protein